MKRNWKAWIAGLLLLWGGGLAFGDELQLVFVLHPNWNKTPLYVRQASGSRDANVRGITVGRPLELSQSAAPAEEQDWHPRRYYGSETYFVSR